VHGTSWLGCLLCQKVLLRNRLTFGRAYSTNGEYLPNYVRRSILN
jgi:hypothetical protein